MFLCFSCFVPWRLENKITDGMFFKMAGSNILDWWRWPTAQYLIHEESRSTGKFIKHVSSVWRVTLGRARPPSRTTALLLLDKQRKGLIIFSVILALFILNGKFTDRRHITESKHQEPTAKGHISESEQTDSTTHGKRDVRTNNHEYLCKCAISFLAPPVRNRGVGIVSDLGNLSEYNNSVKRTDWITLECNGFLRPF